MLRRGGRVCMRKLAEAKAPRYEGISPTTRYTDTVTFREKGEDFHIYQVMDTLGKVNPGATPPDIPEAQMVSMYETMVKSDVMDHILYDSQRQGRISFYMTNYGEEASHVGSASALADDDIVYAQYRESGVLLWRGFTLQQMCDQCFSNHRDIGKGRQMPVHYGSKDLHFHTISSPLSTQIPQAAGAAYSLKLRKEDRVAVCYFGDGAASEGDCHAGFNFAATLDAPAIFFIRNNGFAISTPVSDQYRGDGIAARGPGYGIPTIRVDGNDILAVYEVTKQAREIALTQSRPVIIEAMTYRIGHHSTSDDSTRYRSETEIEMWRNHNDPIYRFKTYLQDLGLWDDERESAYRKSVRTEVVTAFKEAANAKKPSLDDIFTDVYDVKPKHIEAQERELHQHLQKHAPAYEEILKQFK